jgi:hypothetical protein
MGATWAEIHAQVLHLTLLAFLYIGIAWWVASWQAPEPRAACEANP